MAEKSEGQLTIETSLERGWQSAESLAINVITPCRPPKTRRFSKKYTRLPNLLTHLLMKFQRQQAFAAYSVHESTLYIFSSL